VTLGISAPVHAAVVDRLLSAPNAVAMHMIVNSAKAINFKGTLSASNVLSLLVGWILPEVSSKANYSAAAKDQYH
jgi:hypothetical protein